MRIVLVYHEISFRGGEEYFRILSKGLIAQGHAVTLITGRITKQAKIFPKEVKIIAPPHIINNLFGNTFFYILFAPLVLFILLLLHTAKADVLYTGESFLNLWPTILVSKLIPKKVVLLVFELSNYSKFTKSPSGIVVSLFQTIHTVFIKQVRVAISINESLVPLLKNKYNIPVVKYIPPGIDLQSYTNSSTKKIIDAYNLSGKNVIVMPGLLHPAKHQHIAIQTLAQVKEIHPDTMLFIIGDGNEDYKKSLMQLVQQLQLEKSVVLTGFVADKEIKNYYAVADMVLMCGPIAGFTVIESLIMHKMPVYPTSGIPPLGPVEPLNVGIIVKHDKPKYYAQVITDYFNNPQKFKRKIADDRQMILKTYSLDSFVQKVLQTID